MSFLNRWGNTALGLFIRPASAHCDTADGPAVVDGARALEGGNINLALKWVHDDAEPELKSLFDQVQRVRKLGPEAAAVADRLFLETLVRLHRAGEGAGFEGIKPTGTHLPPAVRGADVAMADEKFEPLGRLVPADRRDGLERRFKIAISKKGFDPNDLRAARDYVAAYVDFFKYAEGEEHGHHHPGAPAHESGHGQHPHAH